MKKRIAMIMLSLTAVFLMLSPLCGCESFDHHYPLPVTIIESAIDELLNEAEEAFALGNFRDALLTIDDAAFLLSRVDDEAGFREFRILFDRALALTCLEGKTEMSLSAIKQVEVALKSKECFHVEETRVIDQPNETFEEPTVMSIEECQATIDNIKELLFLGLIKLNLKPRALVTVDFFINTLGNEAKKCCTEEGFWKSCMQPILTSLENSWRHLERLDHYMIPPDPYWD